jgi:hypothetical protein
MFYVIFVVLGRNKTYYSIDYIPMPITEIVLTLTDILSELRALTRSKD